MEIEIISEKKLDRLIKKRKVELEEVYGIGWYNPKGTDKGQIYRSLCGKTFQVIQKGEYEGKQYFFIEGEGIFPRVWVAELFIEKIIGEDKGEEK